MTTATKNPSDKMTSADIRQKGIGICQKINDAAHIGASVYTKAPAGVQICIASIDKDKFRIWPGFADIEIIDANPKFRQVVLRVVEEKRKIEKHVKSHVPGVARNQDGEWIVSYGHSAKVEDKVSRLFQSGAPTRQVLMSEINISLPEGTRYSASIEDRYEEEVTVRHWNGEKSTRWELYDWVKVTAHVPASDMVLLAGYDEDALFICELPKLVSSVEQAHEVLVPPEVKRASSYERQGEWFFVPVSEAEVSRIAKVMATGKVNDLRTREGRVEWEGMVTSVTKLPMGIEACNYGSYVPLEPGSSHRASTYVEISSKSDRIKYVSGFITDTRKGHHKPLFLNGWHRIHRNTEVVRNLNAMTSARTSRRRYWD